MQGDWQDPYEWENWEVDKLWSTIRKLEIEVKELKEALNKIVEK